MLPDRVSNPGPLTYESGALPIALRGPACSSFSSAGKFYTKSGVSCLQTSLMRHKEKLQMMFRFGRHTTLL